MFNTYRDRKVAITVLTFTIWLVLLLLKIDVDKKESLKREEGISLESVEETKVNVSQTPEWNVTLEDLSEDESSQQEEIIEQETTGVIVEDFIQYPELTYSKDWTYEESYMLAKIAMAEAEGESLHGKILVILTVLNRVHEDSFPNTIGEVIFQQTDGVYQFSPMVDGGRWWTTEPNEECWTAVEIIRESKYDYSYGALYFESCKDKDNWHSRNLEFLYQEGNHRFYK